jgi:hypothetical protein
VVFINVYDAARQTDQKKEPSDNSIAWLRALTYGIPMTSVGGIGCLNLFSGFSGMKLQKTSVVLTISAILYNFFYPSGVRSLLATLV